MANSIRDVRIRGVWLGFGRVLLLEKVQLIEKERTLSPSQVKTPRRYVSSSLLPRTLVNSFQIIETLTIRFQLFYKTTILFNMPRRSARIVEVMPELEERRSGALEAPSATSSNPPGRILNASRKVRDSTFPESSGRIPNADRKARVSTFPKSSGRILDVGRKADILTFPEAAQKGKRKAKASALVKPSTASDAEDDEPMAHSDDGDEDFVLEIEDEEGDALLALGLDDEPLHLEDQEHVDPDVPIDEEAHRLLAKRLLIIFNVLRVAAGRCFKQTSSDYSSEVEKAIKDLEELPSDCKTWSEMPLTRSFAHFFLVARMQPPSSPS